MLNKQILLAVASIILSCNLLLANNDYIYIVSTPSLSVDTNYVVQYEIVAEDSLEYISAYSTGGLGYSNTAKSEIVVNSSKSLLFCTNVKSQDISVFNIKQNGSLEAVEGSPFHTFYERPANLVLHPSGKYLYAGHARGLCWFSINEDGGLVFEDTTENVFFPRGMQISHDGKFLYAADLAGGIRIFSINELTGALTESPKSPVTYEPMQRTNKIYLAEDSNIIYALDIDKGTFGFEIIDGDSLRNVSSGPLANKGTSGSSAAYSADNRHFFIAYRGWIYSYKTFDSPPLIQVGAKAVQTAGIGYFTQLLVHPSTNVLYSFSDYYNVIYFHKADQLGTLSEIHPYLPINSKEGYTPAGAVLVYDFATSIDENDNASPLTSFHLMQNYPNPFNPRTTIRYQLPETERVRIIVYDILGRPVKSLFNNYQTPGEKEIEWDGKNDFGQAVNSGVYVLNIVAGKNNRKIKMLLLK